MSTAKAASDSQVMTGADILVKSLVDHGVDVLFAYPGGCSMPMHQALTRYDAELRTILPRHEQGGAFAAQGYARSTGRVGVVMATSGPGATNLVTGVATAMMDSSPIVCITGQVHAHLIGGDAFQETDVTGITLPITKHNYLVRDADDMAGGEAQWLNTIQVGIHDDHTITAGIIQPGADGYLVSEITSQLNHDHMWIKFSQLFKNL